ncbi:MAG TPA: hypothetical protein PLO51_01870, partial [Candidatus Micrarchaeota archaeon]|nr:hypothetical protein [Candidatus Micrarchaeota archaeon]
SSGSAGTCAVTNKVATLDVTIPGVIGGAYQFTTLVNDYIDRTLGNRVKTNAEDKYAYTSNKDSDQQSDANPLRFVSGSQAVYKITGSSFSPFATYIVQDPKAAKTYTEEQALYVAGSGQYKQSASGPIARYTDLAYQVRFTNDDYGLAYCAASSTTNDSACQNSDLTANHRVPIEFLGSEWRISQLSTPSTAVTTNNTQYPIAGGTVKLAKESAYKIVNIGETLDAGNFKVKLSDISVATGQSNSHPAIVDILDANGAVLSQQQIEAGSTYTFTSGGQSARIHVYQTSPGFTLNAKWAEMAVYSDELTLTDGQQVDDSNTGWKAKLLWKNRDTSVAPVSALREILLYTTDTGIINNDFAKGDAVTVIASPAVFKLTFDGVDLADADYDTLTFTVDNSANPLLIANTSVGAEQCTNTVSSSASLLRVSTGVANGFTVTAGAGGSYSSDTVYYDNTNGVAYVQGSSNQNCYYVVNNTATAPASLITVQYKTMGSIGSTGSGGAFTIAAANISSNTASDVVTLYEDAGRYNDTSTAVDTMKFNASNIGNYTSPNFQFKANSGDTGRVAFSVSGPAVPSGSTTSEAPYMSDRGSLFTSMSTDTVQFNIAKKVGHLQWTLSTQGTNVTDASEFTLTEGQTQSLTGGISVTLKSISETVGSCTASGSGAPTCTVDMTPVKAVILPDNVASVQVSQPYKLTSKMVVLDSEASSAGSVITVGGPAVNTVTADALAGSSVDLSTTTVLVQAIGNKIVVAGLTAADTVTAADRFIAGIKQQ